MVLNLEISKLRSEIKQSRVELRKKSAAMKKKVKNDHKNEHMNKNPKNKRTVTKNVISDTSDEEEQIDEQQIIYDYETMKNESFRNLKKKTFTRMSSNIFKGTERDKLLSELQEIKMEIITKTKEENKQMKKISSKPATCRQQNHESRA